MSSNVKEVLLIGTGYMGREYVKVLKAQNINFTVVGNSAASTQRFSEETGVPAQAGGIERWFADHSKDHPRLAIVAVQADYAANVVLAMLPHGFDRVMVEKPCGLTEEETRKISELAEWMNTKVIVAYNRRFYASVLAAEKIIAKDNGVTSFCFELTERGFAPQMQDVGGWFIGNDTHVADLAFFLGGEPETLFSIAQNTCGAGKPNDQAAFAGCGVTKKQALFSYQANWFAPGRWSVEMMTKANRLIFRPMETLQIQKMGSFAIEKVEIEDELDRLYKPGLFLETKEFLENPENPRFLTIQEQAEHMKCYFQMLRGNQEQVRG